MDRSERDLEIVRQTAEILSSGSALSETFERFCLMLAEFIDASVVFIAVDRPDGATIDFTYDHGESAHPHRRIDPESQTQQVLDTGQPIFIQTLGELRGPLIPLKRDDDSHSAMFVPLRFGAETIGVLSVQTTQEYAYSSEDLRLMETCALYAAVSVQAESVRSEKEILQTVASRDALTGVGNRRAFDQRLKEDWARAQRENGTISILVLDVDWFKRFNDTYGHVAGDACLNQVAQAAQSCVVRESDLFARFGGEEFIAILWATDTAGATVVGERILHAVRGLGVPHAESPLGRVTASIGIASAAAAAVGDPQMLVKAADRALYAAKTAGRDRLVVDALGGELPGTRQRIAHSNIRTPSTPLLGRTFEVANLTEALKHGRLVTITGAPGLGKTRVAIAAAQRRLYAYPDGTWLVNCSTAGEGARLDATVLGILGIPQFPDASPRDALLAALAPKNLLLVFDDFQYIAADVRGLVEAIAAAAPAVTMLATGPQPVGANGEDVFELMAPGRMDAVALFVERAQTVAPEFDLNEKKRKLVERICAKLDNVPLAIELTASRVASIPLEEIAAALERDVRAQGITPGRGPIGPAIDWSYRLLSDNASRLFERLSAFPAACSLDAARDVCAGAGLEPWDVAGALDELVAANLVQSVVDAREQPRFATFEMGRAYGRERLAHRHENEAVRRRFIGCFRALARRMSARLEGGQVEPSIDALSAEIENLYAALDYALGERIDPAAGVDIAIALRRFWAETGRLSQGRYWTELALNGDLPPGERRAEVLSAAAVMAYYTGDMVRLAALSEELVAFHDTRDDASALAKSLTGLANARLRLGNATEAKALFERALEGYRKAGDRRGTAVALLDLGSYAAQADGDRVKARDLFLESLEHFRALGSSRHCGSALSNLAGISIGDGAYAPALAYANESLAIFERLGNHAYAASALLHVAHARIELREFDAAREALAGAHAKLRREPAIRYFVQFFEIGFLFAYATGAFELAARLLGQLDALRERHARTAVSLSETATRENALRERLGGGFAACYEQGKAGEPATLESELDEALAGGLTKVGG